MTIRIRALGTQAVTALKAIEAEIKAVSQAAEAASKTTAASGAASTASSKQAADFFERMGKAAETASKQAVESNTKLETSLKGVAAAEKEVSAEAKAATDFFAKMAAANDKAAKSGYKLADAEKAVAAGAAGAKAAVAAAAGQTVSAAAPKTKKARAVSANIVGAATGAEAAGRIKLNIDASEAKAANREIANQLVLENKLTAEQAIRANAAVKAAREQAIISGEANAKASIAAKAVVKAEKDALDIANQQVTIQGNLARATTKASRDKLAADNASLNVAGQEARAKVKAARDALAVANEAATIQAATARAAITNARNLQTIQGATGKIQAGQARANVTAARNAATIAGEQGRLAADAARAKAAADRNSFTVNNAAAAAQARANQQSATQQRQNITNQNAAAAAQARTIRANMSAARNASTIAGASAASQAQQIRAAKSHANNLKTISQANQGLVGSLASAKKATSDLGAALANTFSDKTASRIQWMGRQITYNFSMPLALAATAGIKMALDQEKAFTRLSKVYGDVTHQVEMGSRYDPTSVTAKELVALRSAFVTMSNYFGVAQEDVVTIGADWAQAGASGVALAKSVRLTLETMILGELDAKTATTGLIALQAQWGVSMDEAGADALDLVKIIDILNQTENETTTSFPDLLEAFTRAAGSARTAGVTVEQLAALVASIVPAAGDAATAGNALKTIFSRIMAPTREAAEVMGMMGLNTKEASWQSLTAVGRIEKMGEAWGNLTQPQKDVVSAVVASRWQISRFDILMEDIINSTGRYQSALRATSDPIANMKQRQQELNAVLQSNPVLMQRAWQEVRNSLLSAIVPLLPMITGFAKQLADLVAKFQTLSPETQKFIGYLVLFLIVLGPAVRLLGALGTMLFILLKPFTLAIAALRYFGSLLLALGRLALVPFRLIGVGVGYVLSGLGFLLNAIKGVGRWAVSIFTKIPGLIVQGWSAIPKIAGGVFSWLMRGLAGLAGAIFSVPGLVITLVIGLFALFRDQISIIWDNLQRVLGNATSGIVQITDGISKLWNALVAGIITAFNQLPLGIKNALQGVIDLVGKAALKVYELFSYMNPFAKHSPSLVESVAGGMGKVKEHFGAADSVAGTMQTAADNTENFKKATSGIPQASKFAEDRANVAAQAPQALPAFDALEGSYNDLIKIQKEYDSAIKSQSAVVRAWQDKLEAANDALDAQQKIMDGLQKTLDDLQKKYDDASNKVQDFANAPIEGMGNLSEAMFNNQQAANELKLKMMDWEAANGSIDTIRDRFSKLADEIQVLLGMQDDLRAKGAGSDILGPISDQIAALQGQKNALGAGGTVNTSQYDQMATALATLETEGQRLDLVNSVTFDPLTHQIENLANAQKEMPFDTIVAGIIAQRDIMATLTPQIDAATLAVNNQQVAVDAAKATVDSIQASYDAESKMLDLLKLQYQDITDRIQEVTDALNTMGAAAKAAADKAAGAGGKLTPGGQNFLDAAAGDFPTAGGLSGIGREGDFTDQSQAIKDAMADLQASLGQSFANLDIFKPLRDKWDEFTAWWRTSIMPPLREIGQGIYDTFNIIFSGSLFEGLDLVTPLQTAWQKVQDWFGGIDTFATIGRVFSTMGNTLGFLFSNLWTGIKDTWDKLGPAFSNLMETIGPLVKSLLPALGAILGAVVGAIIWLIGAIAGALGPVIEMIINVFTDLINIISGIIQVVTAVIQIFIGAFVFALKMVMSYIGFVVDLVTGVIKVFAALFTFNWEALGNAFKGIGQAIVDFFGNIIANVLGFFGDIGSAIGNLLSGLFDIIKGLMSGIWDIISGVFATIWGALIGGFAALVGVIGAFLGEVGNAIFDTINNTLQWIASVPGLIADFGRFLIEGLWNGLKGAWEWLRNLIGGLWDGFIQWFKDIFGISSPSSLFAEFGRWLIEGLWNGLKAAWTWITDFFGSIGGWIWDTISGLGQWFYDRAVEFLTNFWNGLVWYWETIGTFFASIGGWIWEKISGLAVWFYDKAVEFLTSFFNGYKFIGLQIWEWFGQIGTFIWEKVSPLLNWFVEKGKAILTWIWDGIKAVATDVWNWFGNIGTWIWEKISALASNITGFGKSIIKWIVNGLGDIASGIFDFGAWIWGKIKDIGGTIGSYGSQLIKWIIEGLGGIAFDFATWVWNAIKDIGYKFIQFGKDIGRWIIDGIKEFFKSLIFKPQLNADGTGYVTASAGMGVSKEGGLVTGPGTGTSDSILMRLSNGEFVINARATRNSLKLLEAINSGEFNALNIQGPYRQAQHGGYVSRNRSTAAATYMNANTQNTGGIVIHNENHTLNFTGDLVLPNIQNGDDAQSLVDSLYALAKGR